MGFYYKFIFMLTIISMFSVWSRGYRANRHPDKGGFVSNWWNSDEYCCLYWETKQCWAQLKNDLGNPKCYITHSLEPVSCLPEKPEFDWYEKDGCDTRFRSPEGAKIWCREGDVWPDCIAESVRIKPRQRVWLLMHVALLFLIASRSWLFTAYVVLVLLNSY